MSTSSSHCGGSDGNHNDDTMNPSVSLSNGGGGGGGSGSKVEIEANVDNSNHDDDDDDDDAQNHDDDHHEKKGKTTTTTTEFRKDEEDDEEEEEECRIRRQKREGMEEWEAQRDEWKRMGDDAFRGGDYLESVSHYTRALGLDPTNHVLLSNRSGAHLGASNKSKALADARACIEHAPTTERRDANDSTPPAFLKGYSRLGAALQSLGRYEDAREAYATVLRHGDPNHPVATEGIRICDLQLERRRKRQQQQEEEEEEEERKKSKATAAADDDDEEGAEAARDHQEQNNNHDEDEAVAVAVAGGGDDGDGDDLLDDFFSEVENATTTTTTPRADGETTLGNDDEEYEEDGQSSSNHNGNKNSRGGGGGGVIREQKSDLGTAKEQIDRLLAENYRWKNLNPFRVLDMEPTEDVELISRRYKALSLLLHPDKCRHVPLAKEAYDEVQQAKSTLLENYPEKCRHVCQLVERGRKRGQHEWQQQKQQQQQQDRRAGNATMKAETLHEMQEKAVQRLFAEIEQKRREVERRHRKQEQRERDQEEEVLRKERHEREFDQQWKEETRVGKRVGNWRDFQKMGSKKPKI